MKEGKIFTLTLSVILAATLPASSLTIPTTLQDELTGNQIGEGTRNLVICIHGWNNPPNPNRYTEYEWAALVAELKIALPKTGSDPWALLPYRWEDDADTGGVFGWPNPYQDNAVANANAAAAFAWSHGDSLGPRLPLSLRRVHIIAHSAGAWAARQTALSVLENNRFVVVQITLLDPYVPDSVLPHSYNVSKLNDLALADFLYSGRVSLLENYYADDSPIGGWDSTMTPAPTLGTQNTFVWRGNDINQRVDWGAVIVAPPGLRSPLYQEHYDWHSGPIYFYADTLSAAAGYPSASLPTGSPFHYQQRGWYRSLCYRTQQGQLPRITTQPVGQSSTESSVILSVTASGSGPFTYRWYKNKSLIIGANSPTHTVNSSTDPPTPYVVRVTDANGNHFFSDEAVVTFYSAPPQPSAVPAIASVSPSSLPPSSSTQLLNIYGSNFKPSGDPNASTLIVRDPANIAYVRTPIFVSSSQLQYNITVQSEVGTWSVTVTNAGQAASNLKTFLVQTPPPNTGSLTINLLPPGAVFAGAQWQVDGGSYRNNGDTANGLTPGSHTVSFKSVSGYTTPPEKFVSITSGANASDSATYIAVMPSTYTLMVSVNNSAQGSVTASPTGAGSGIFYAPGSSVRLTATPANGYHFVNWGRDASASGAVNPTTIVMDGNKTVTANFDFGDWSVGSLRVTIEPPGAVAAGARWRDNGGAWTNGSVTVNNAYIGEHYLDFSDVAGWARPIPHYVAVVGGQTTNLVATYTQTTTSGTLLVILTPPDAVTAGAKWRVNAAGGAPQNNGASVSLPPGNYSVTFDSAQGWTPPVTQSVTIQPGQTCLARGDYTPPLGQPAIGSIRPSIGRVAGGTLITIDGLNFSSPVSATFGGKPAANVSVVSSTRITCLTPPGATYGTVPVIVQAGGVSATNLTGFTYTTERGNNLNLLAQSGGAVNSAAVQGNHAFIGQGSKLVVLDISNPASPSPVGNGLLLGSTLNNIKIVGNYAYIANAEDGLQVVNIAAPTRPALVGTFNTLAAAQSVALSGSLAYVAVGGAGLQIVDVSDPANLRQAGAVGTEGTAFDVAVSVSAQGVFAYVCNLYGDLKVVDVTTPASGSIVGSLSIGGNCYSATFEANRVYVGSLEHGVVIVSVSDPRNPTQMSSIGTRATGIAYSNGKAFSVGAFGLHVFDVTNPNSPEDLASGVSTFRAFPGQISIMGGYAFVSAGSDGFRIIDVSNPTAPTQRGQYAEFMGYAGDLASVNDTLYVAMDKTLEILDVNDPIAPVRWSSFSPAQQAQQVRVLSNRAYILEGGFMEIVDISNPKSASLLGTVQQSPVYAHDIFVSGTLGYVAGNAQPASPARPTLRIVDLSQPSAPVERSSLLLLSGDEFNAASGITVRGNFAYIVLDGIGLRIVDVTNLGAPRLRGLLAGLGRSLSVSLTTDGTHALVASEIGGVKIVDVSEADNPRLVGTYSDGGLVYGTELAGDIAYVADGQKGVVVLDISDRSNPRLIRSYDTPGSAQAVAVSGDTLFVADGYGGILVLTIPDTQPPDVFITNPTFSPTLTATVGTLNLGGTATDNKGVTRVAWSNNRGGGGDTSLSGSNWSANGITLQPGANVLTVVAFDQAGNSGSDTLTVTYNSPKQDQTITFPATANLTFGDPPIPLVAAASSGRAVAFSLVSGPASLTDNVLSLLGAGTVTVRASQPGDDSFNPALPKEMSFTVAKADQGIGFAAPPDKSLGDPPFVLSATASSGLLVKLEIVSGSATISDGKVTITGAGHVVVRASQAGDDNYNAAAPVEHSFTVAKAPQFITFGSLSGQVAGDAPFALSASASSGLQVSFSVLQGPAIVSGNIVTITGAGLVVLRGSQSGDATYAPAPNVDQVLSVAPGINVITDAQQLENGMFTLRFYGELGRDYVVQASTNLVNWLPVATNQVSGLGYLEFTDTSSTNYDRRFYRIAP